MIPLTERFPEIRHGSVITAVDLIRGIGRYAGLRVISVPGATGLYDTNFEGKAQAAIDALLGTDPAAPAGGDDFVYLHVEASDEAGHDGSVPLKLQTIEDLDHRLIQPILKAFYHAPAAEPPGGPSSAQGPALAPSSTMGPVLGGSSAEPPLAIALLPDHPTPCELRTHTAEPIPFAIYYPGIEPDGVQTFDEAAAREGAYGQLEGDEFIKEFMKTPSSFPLKGEGGYLQSL
jgi:2,3-bisphosphoglycerate-independent phosphoglycerate mutase